MPFPFEFVIFAATLVGVAVFHHNNVQIAIGGLIVVVLYKLGIAQDVDLLDHFLHEWRLVFNLLGLLVGFEILAYHFRQSKLAERVPAILPNGWFGGFMLLLIIWAMSGGLDNIAAAMIGNTIATIVYRGKVTVGYLAAIVAASNAGGAGSVIGDTTTTMMWIAGVAPLDVSHAYFPSIVALVVFGIPLSKRQDRHQRISKDTIEAVAPVDYVSLVVVALILAGTIATNILLDFPAVGVWGVILATMKIRKPNWHHVPKAITGATFLLSLVLSASLMPVESLPAASPEMVFALGFVSSVFDNIPLTKLALDQGGYDWGWLAYAVGFGGSMMWFGSSAGVAVSNNHPQLKNTIVFLKESWPIPVAYVVGFLPLNILGWAPHAPIL
jgi:Na+/H+ antiporter NhaD/arsenite permease-like protein